jgi:hypothetical protein
MRVLIPFPDELLQLCAQMVFGLEVDDTQAFALQDAEPLFDLIHPRAMHRREVEDESRMVGYPLLDFFPMMRTDIVAHEMNGAKTHMVKKIETAFTAVSTTQSSPHFGLHSGHAIADTQR